MLTCIIVEDQAPAQRVLQKYIADYGRLELKAVCTDAVSALEFLKNNTVDLMFLDIHLPRISGMDFLKTLHHPPAVILTTAFQEYAVESYEHNVADYLVKPFSFARFVKAVSKVQRTGLLPVSPPEGIECMIKSGHEYLRFNSSDILFIRTDMDYAEIHFEGRKLLSSETLTYWEQKLGRFGFVRIHRSFLVNLSKLQKIAGNRAHIDDTTVLPVGRAYKEQLLERWKKN